MKREHMPFKYMGNFKAIAIDFEYYLTLSDKPVSVCMTERQMYILSAWNTYTYWFTRWYNTDDTSEAQIKLIAAELEDLLMCGCGVPVPSITDILNAQTYTTNTAASYITTYNTWNDAGQTVISIAPNLDYGTGVPANIDKLMCLGLNMLLVSIVEQAKSIKQGEIDDAKDITKQLASALSALGVAAGAATGVGGAAAAFVGFLGGPWLLFGLALGAVGLTIASIVIPADLSVFTDAQAFEDVYCTMVNNLVGNQPTRAAFQGALTPNSFAPGSLAAQLAAVVQTYLDDLDMYLQFLVQMNGLYEVSNFTLLPECACLPGAITLTKIGYGGQVFGIVPSVVQDGDAFVVQSTAGPANPGDRLFAFIFDKTCALTLNSTTWAFCSISPDAALWGYCPLGVPDPTNLAYWIFTREVSGATTLDIPPGLECLGIWIEGACGTNFTANITLEIV